MLAKMSPAPGAKPSEGPYQAPALRVALLRTASSESSSARGMQLRPSQRVERLPAIKKRLPNEGFFDCGKLAHRRNDLGTVGRCECRQKVVRWHRPMNSGTAASPPFRQYDACGRTVVIWKC